MKKKWLYLVIIMIVIIGIGGNFYMKKNVEQKEQELIDIEKELIVALKNTFADVKSVKIEENSGKHKQTGSYRIFVNMENLENESVTFSIIYVTGEKTLDNYVLADETIQKEGETLTSISVSYSDGKEEEL